jgi:hypothetical protein
MPALRSVAVGDQSRLQGLDHDKLSKLLADSQTRIAHLADEISLACQQSNNLVFAKTKFAQAILHFGAGAELANTHRHTGFDPA